ncbi:MAG: FkbM family methyltransferase [Acetobacteraceae bacterium]
MSPIIALYETLRLLTPYDINIGKIRMGNKMGDGGYVIADCLRLGQPVFSFGIGSECSFDLQLAERGHPVFQYDHTIDGPPFVHPGFHFHRLGLASESDPAVGLLTLHDHVAAVRPRLGGATLLKIDVEGAEWSVLAAADDMTLGQFDQIVVEVHGLLQLWKPEVCDCAHRALSNLTKQFTLFHVHANNYAPVGVVGPFVVCDVMELSYIRSDLVRRAPSRTLYPTALDTGNNAQAQDIPLWFFPFAPEVPVAEGERRALLHRLERVVSW